MKNTPKTKTKKTKSIRPRKPPQERLERAQRIWKQLKRLYPDAHCALDHDNAYQLLIATILSAQCTDVRVNMVTPALFKKYPNPAAMAAAPLSKIEKAIQSTGFYRNKAKSLQASSQAIVQHHQGKVPDTMEQLLSLRGVARKTANVVLGNAYGKNEGVVVDTHIGRLSRRLGFSKHNDPNKVEQDLMLLFNRKHWTLLAHLLIWHGRSVCSARKPQCDQCTLSKDCKKVGVTTT